MKERIIFTFLDKIKGNFDLIKIAQWFRMIFLATGVSRKKKRQKKVKS